MGNRSVSSAMVMTAGLGTRLRPFTNLRTKALLPVLGIPAAQYSIDTLVLAGVKKIVANVHHLADDTRERLKKLDFGTSTLRLSDESSELLGTAGGLRHAAKDLGPGPFFRSHADVICEMDWQALAEKHDRLREKYGVLMTLAIAMESPPGAEYAEIVFDPSSGLIRGIGSSQARRPFWTGAAVIEPEAMVQVPASGPSELVPQMLLPAIQKGMAGVYISSGYWSDIGSPGLWLDTHFDVMSRFENQTSDGVCFQRWRERFLNRNTRLGDGIWVEKALDAEFRLSPGRFRGQAYWGKEGRTDLNETPEFQVLGPSSILYGSLQGAGSKIQNGIAFGGHWMKK